MKGINTARLDALTQIEALNPEQIAAVRKLRKRAKQMNVSVYTLGVLCSRSHALDKLSDARDLRKLSPATREVLIAGVQDLTRPYIPAVVAVYSAWCDQHGVDPEATNRVSVPLPDPAQDLRVEDRSEQIVADAAERKPQRKLYDRGARAACTNELRAMLSNGPLGTGRIYEQLCTVKGFSRGTLHNAANDLHVIRTGSGKTWSWRLPNPVAVTHEPEQAPERTTPERTTIMRELDLPRVQHKAKSWEQKAMAAEARVQMIADEIGVRFSTLCRWTEMYPLYHGRRSIVGTVRIGDRESDEGIELAERVFLACGVFSPEALVQRRYERLRESS